MPKPLTERELASFATAYAAAAQETRDVLAARTIPSLTRRLMAALRLSERAVAKLLKAASQSSQ